MKILVTGKNGQLGKSIQNLVQEKIEQKSCFNDFKFIDSLDLDLEDTKNINSYFKNKNFDLLINCAAYTNVDKAELDEKQAIRLNHLAVKEFAKIAKKNDFSFIHISTDFVFDGKKVDPYLESDPALPLNIYGKTKLDGEKAILSEMKSKAVIIRTSWLFSEFGNNFVDTILNISQKNNQLNIVNDQIGCPTYATDLAKTILNIIDSKNFSIIEDESQIYHYSNAGECSWFDFAQEIVNHYQINCNLNPISSQDYPLPAKRPKYSSLNKNKITKDFDLSIDHWRESLRTCLKNLKLS